MKKVILSMALVTGVAVAASAQSASFGIKAGASLTNFTGKGTDGSDLKNKFGFNGGFIANLPVNDAFSIQPELLYSMKGYKFSGSDALGTTIDSKETLHYLDVPILARVNAGGLFFELGPQIGFLVAAKYSAEGSNGQSGSYSTKSDYKAVDFGYAAGLGYQMPTGPGIGLRYNGGFIDVFKNNNGGNAVHNSAFQLYLTYMFGGK